MATIRLGRAWAWTAIFLAIASPAAAAATYDESVLGDLSGVAASPTPWLLEVGPNRLTGSAFSEYVEIPPASPELVGFDYDLVALTIPAGYQLDSIIVDSYVNVDEVAQSFVGLQAGSPWLDGFGWDVTGAHLLGYAHLQNYMPLEKTDVLFDMFNVAEAFTIPLSSGVYTMLIEDIDSRFTYSLVFNVSAVPEPSTFLMGGIGATLLAVRRRRGDR